MAYYEFECKKCEHRFDVKQTFEEHEHHPEVKCPNCGSTRVEQVFTPVFAKTSKKS